MIIEINPTHEEILLRWWKVGFGWYRVSGYIHGEYRINDVSKTKEMFSKMESCIIPEEQCTQ